MADLEKEIKVLVSKIIKIPEKKIDANVNIFYDLGVDSLLGVEIFAALDKKYHIDIPENRLKDVTTLNDIIALVREIKESRAL
ncbi:MAG: acyl carrier protein [Candidatus Margulisbacteria bacterium]|nr:acyl carrier protein [Candidatus Margulisiibacteriota bacterium]MBU1021696.1 acyl carrier protein [Candidatus Margulisiibacteriota bacterium]MBU1729574.1 acyl carrier protein [Candidatus Margulisiibacteriota bacterium]MBU1955060.1 acyl carrier protein [Candidatus Margulisiibacteriota bacterium]